MRYRVAVAQFRPRKGDYAHNLARVGEIFGQLQSLDPRPDVLVLPETALSGYFVEGGVREAALPAEVVYADLLRTYRERVKSDEAVLDVALGFYELGDGKYYNSALYATLTSTDGAHAQPGVAHVHRKFFLPTYGVFDEKRFVARGRTVDAFPTRFGTASVLICEDVWHSITATIAALEGAQVIYVLSASPGREFGGEQLGSLERWRLLLPGIASEHNVYVVYAGLVGFEGGKGFTGSSSVVDPWGRTLVEGPVLEECLVAADVDLDDVAVARAASPLLADLEAGLTDLVLELEAVARRPHMA